VAANLYLDALAHYRRSLGRPALSVDWTAVADVGFLTQRPEVRDHLERLGLAAMPTGRLLTVLGELLRRDAVQTAVMRFDGRRWAQHAPTVAALPRFGSITRGAEAGAEPGDASRRAAILAAPAAERQQMLEGCLREQVGKVLGTAPAGLELAQPLNGLGLDSLMAVELGTRLNKSMGVEMPTMRLLSGASLADLLADIGAQIHATSGSAAGSTPTAVVSSNGVSIDWARETNLDADIVPQPSPTRPAGGDAPVLLTGATGFLGAFLLRELMRQTEQDVLCLVRCRDEADGQRRLRGALESYHLWEDSFDHRIHAVPGDLTEPALGLTPADYQLLVSEAGAIYHNGAHLNLSQSYSALRSANVLSTKEVLRLAVRGRQKVVHFVSSLGVFDLPKAGERVVCESDVPDDLEGLRFGYTRSKAVAERLVHEAGARGVQVVVYRPGLINPSAANGACTTQDFAARLFKSCIVLGAAPDLDRELLLTPVDYVSRALVSLSRRTDSPGRTFHLVNPHAVSMRELYGMVREAGYPLLEVSDEEWRDRLLALVKVTPDEALVGIVSFLSAFGEVMPTWPPPNIRFGCQATLGSLGDQIPCPPIDAELVGRCLDYFEGTGFFRAAEREFATPLFS
jgi:thioester reductase-like protein